MPDGIDRAELEAAERLLRETPEYAWITESGQQWYTVSEVVEATTVAATTVRAWCDRGQIAGAVFYGQQIGWRMPRSGLLLFFASLARGGRRGHGDADGQAG